MVDKKDSVTKRVFIISRFREPKLNFITSGSRKYHNPNDDNSRENGYKISYRNNLTNVLDFLLDID